MQRTPLTSAQDPEPARSPEAELAALRAENARLREALAGALRVSAAGRMEPVEAVVPAGPYAPAEARRAVAGWLEGRVSDAVLSDARLVVSELVTAGLHHGGLEADAPIRVRAELAEGVLRLEVRDPGFERPARDPLHGDGFGLDLVGLVAARWGVRRTGGTDVWVELAAE